MYELVSKYLKLEIDMWFHVKRVGENILQRQ